MQCKLYIICRCLSSTTCVPHLKTSVLPETGPEGCDFPTGVTKESSKLAQSFNNTCVLRKLHTRTHTGFGSFTLTLASEASHLHTGFTCFPGSLQGFKEACGTLPCQLSAGVRSLTPVYWVYYFGSDRLTGGSLHWPGPLWSLFSGF